MAHCHSFPPLEVPKDGPKILCTGRHRVGDVVSMRVMFLRLGMRLQAISFDHPVRISRHLLLNIFRTPTLFTHALVPSVFRLEVSVMIQESSSKFFPTGLGIRQPRPATHTATLTGDIIVMPAVTFWRRWCAILAGRQAQRPRSSLREAKGGAEQ